MFRREIRGDRGKACVRKKIREKGGIRSREREERGQECMFSIEIVRNRDWEKEIERAGVHVR